MYLFSTENGLHSIYTKAEDVHKELLLTDNVDILDKTDPTKKPFLKLIKKLKENEYLTFSHQGKLVCKIKRINTFYFKG